MTPNRSSQLSLQIRELLILEDLSPGRIARRIGMAGTRGVIRVLEEQECLRLGTVYEEEEAEKTYLDGINDAILWIDGLIPNKPSEGDFDDGWRESLRAAKKRIRERSDFIGRHEAAQRKNRL